MKTTVKALSAVLCVLCCTVLFGCGGSVLEKYTDSISELRDKVFCAESASYKIAAISGHREDPYEMNGVSGAKRAFTVITVTPTAFAPDKAYRYKAEIGDDVYEGDLLPHPFAQSLSADIPVAAAADFTVSVTCDGTETLAVKNTVPGEIIGAEKALSIALEKLRDELKRFRSHGKLHAEIYVRLMENPIDGNGGYFWYVAFVGEDKSTVAVLLKSDTGAVSAVRI